MKHKINKLDLQIGLVFGEWGPPRHIPPGSSSRQGRTSYHLPPGEGGVWPWAEGLCGQEKTPELRMVRLSCC